jgi:3-oxoacyl-[acyl-carrier protein] reductase
VRVNCIAPDMIPTTGSDAIGDVSRAVSEEAWRPTPWPQVGSVDDVAAAAVFLAGDLAKFVTGSTLHVDGGTWAAGGWKMLAADGRFVV